MSVPDVAIRYVLGLEGWFKERFLSKTVRDEATGCLLWTGSKSDAGGVIQVKVPPRSAPVNLQAGRVAFAHEHGVDALPRGGKPATYVIEHSCGNRLCVEPSHLAKVSAWAARNRYMQMFSDRDRVSN